MFIHQIKAIVKQFFEVYYLYMNVRISIMAAVTDERGLGKDNDLLVKIPEDFQRMKRLTTGHPIIMGRKTFESIGRPLPNRTNIVITRDNEYTKEGILVVHDLQTAITKAKEIEEERTSSVRHPELARLAPKSTPGAAKRVSGSISSSSRLTLHPLPFEGEIFIFGGGQIFKEALPMVDRLYLTVIHKNIEADTFFPDYSEFSTVIEKEEHHQDDYDYAFLTLER